MAHCAAELETMEQEPVGPATEGFAIVLVNAPTVVRYCDWI